MNLKKMNIDLFEFKNTEYKLAHCISQDLKLGAGIAKQFDKHFGMRRLLFNEIDNGNSPRCPGCMYIDPVFNLVTKQKYFHKPTYDSLGRVLSIMRSMVVNQDIQYIAMPKIGCGLDGLKWKNVERMLKSIFDEDDVNIIVCF